MTKINNSICCIGAGYIATGCSAWGKRHNTAQKAVVTVYQSVHSLVLPRVPHVLLNAAARYIDARRHPLL